MTASRSLARFLVLLVVCLLLPACIKNKLT